MLEVHLIEHRFRRGIHAEHPQAERRANLLERPIESKAAWKVVQVEEGTELVRHRGLTNSRIDKWAGSCSRKPYGRAPCSVTLEDIIRAPIPSGPAPDMDLVRGQRLWGVLLDSLPAHRRRTTGVVPERRLPSTGIQIQDACMWPHCIRYRERRRGRYQPILVVRVSLMISPSFLAKQVEAPQRDGVPLALLVFQGPAASVRAERWAEDPSIGQGRPENTPERPAASQTCDILPEAEAQVARASTASGCPVKRSTTAFASRRYIRCSSSSAQTAMPRLRTASGFFHTAQHLKLPGRSDIRLRPQRSGRKLD